MTEPTTIASLAEHYDLLLFDSYGVLVNESTGLPGARELIDWLENTGKNYLIVTNDASRSVPSRAAKFVEQGVPVPAKRIVNSGCLIPRYLRENDLAGEPVAVFGSQNAIGYVEQGGGVVIPLERMSQATVFVLADDSGFDWRSNMNGFISVLNKKTIDGEPFTLLLPNPDIVYPSGEREYSFAAAALAEIIELALQRLFGDLPEHKFVRLGKPYSPIFDEALRRAETSKEHCNVVMIGDQLETDIAGAVSYGIHSAVVTSGISRFQDPEEYSSLPVGIRPDYLLPDLSLDD